ncbi:MAG: hypothetical protein KGZ86_05915 [Candidatus Latescibacteria bacterium]|nr:hypothetical protein [Candidatus Latescibacterota bacterium]
MIKSPALIPNDSALEIPHIKAYPCFPKAYLKPDIHPVGAGLKHSLFDFQKQSATKS